MTYFPAPGTFPQMDVAPLAKTKDGWNIARGGAY